MVKDIYLSRWIAGAALAVTLCLAGAAQAQGPSWDDDARIDLALGAFGDPTLWRVQTELPEPRSRFDFGQPFDQQPLDAQIDFRVQQVLPGQICVPRKGQPCP